MDGITTPTADRHAFTEEEGREFVRIMLHLWEMAVKEADYLAYLFDPHPHNLQRVERYIDLLEERSGIFRTIAEKYGISKDYFGTPPANMAEAAPDLLDYFAKSDERMMTRLKATYGISTPPPDGNR